MKKIVFPALIFISLCFLTGAGRVSQQQVTVKIGVILSLTGNWSSLGVTSQEALNIALDRINKQMSYTGSRYRFSLKVYDSKLEPARALQAIQDAYSNNIRFIIGPQSSAEVEAIKEFADKKGILVISHGSTANSLAIPNDAIFRFCPPDPLEGDAMAQAIYGAGHRALITISRDDAGNKGLQKSIGASFEKRGGIVDMIDPWSPTVGDFTQLLKVVKEKIIKREDELGKGKVAIYLASFDRSKELFKTASTDPVFSSLRWYGGDGIALNTELLSDASAASFAVATSFFAPTLGLPQLPHPERAGIMEAIKNKTAIDADAYTLASYDALWLIAKTIASMPSPSSDFSKIKKLFQFEAGQYYGITGPVYLDEAGDRSTGFFDFWGITKEGGSYSWRWVGKSL